MNLIFLALFVCLVAVQVFSKTELEQANAFEGWVREHGKVYDHEELLYRFRIFKQNSDFIDQFNSEGHSFTVGLNRFADLTNTEFLEKHTGFRRPMIPSTDSGHTEEFDESEGGLNALPASVDWRSKGIVTRVKDQGSCGSCWSFSTTGAVEGAWALNNTLTPLSEQNLMDCSLSYGNYGCNGGLMEASFKYIIANGGIDTEASYPYQQTTSYSCKYSAINKGATIRSYRTVTAGSESSLRVAVANRGPVSVAIDASRYSFQLYTGGLYYDNKCSSSQLNHAVLAVGYGSGTSGAYWIVKNSWGLGWGDQGYVYMARNKNNNCGIATQASYPIV
jgi:cathepsin L